MSEAAREQAVGLLIGLIRSGSYVTGPDLHAAYAIRVLAQEHKPEIVELVAELHQGRTSAMVRRDAILAMANLGDWHWLGDLIRNFRHVSPLERRAFVIASYFMSDEANIGGTTTKRRYPQWRL